MLLRTSNRAYHRADARHTRLQSSLPPDCLLSVCLPACLAVCTGDTVDYIVTGAWSKKAFEEAPRFGLDAHLVAKGDGKSVPDAASWSLSPSAKYVHYCDNETIGGVAAVACCCLRCAA